MLRLAIDTTDPVQRRHVERMYSAAYRVHRALRRRARARARAYRAAHHERARNPAAVRERLRLSREAYERDAYQHLDQAPHLRRYMTKALAMHLADSVWNGTERSLFRDASGKTHGMPRVGGWFEFRRLPGRARSHTTPRKWETFRLHGTLAGHRASYSSSDGTFFQPHRMRAVAIPSSWWDYDGPLAVVFTGLAGGSLVLPVRLPSAPSNQPILDHHLSDPSRWHKIDLVRYRDPTSPGGWRYEAHLMVLVAPYVAPSTRARREAVVIAHAERRGGIDVNVSNITVASHEAGGDLKITRIERDATSRRGDARRARRERRRQRALDRSRRAANRDHYQLSKRQEKRARRRAAAGLRPLEVIPSGPRKARADGKPLRSYLNDRLSATYRRQRAAAASDAQARTRARRDRARRVASDLVRDHGYRFAIEDATPHAWAAQWGRALSAFAPGTLVSAIRREATAVARMAEHDGGVIAASTRTTALSQHCLCGARVAKQLGDRVHVCASCGTRGDRDAISAVLAACVVWGASSDASSARVDFDVCRSLLDAPSTQIALQDTLPRSISGWQDTLSESNTPSAHDASPSWIRGGHPTSSWWLGESLAWRCVQPWMRLVCTRPSQSGCNREPTCPSVAWPPLRDTS